MKLWKKISLICSVVLIVIVAACSTLLLVQSKRNILNLTSRQIEDKLNNLVASFTEMAAYYTDEQDAPATDYALIKYCFTRFADENAVLIADAEPTPGADPAYIDPAKGEWIYSQVSLPPESFIAFGGSVYQDRMAGNIGTEFHDEQTGRDIMLCGSKTRIKQQTYSIYVVEDVTSVYNDITKMIWRFVLISIAGIAVGAALISLLVRRAMQPLTALGKTAKQIATGDYGERATITSQDEVGALAEDFNAMASAVENHVAELTETAARQRMFIGGVTHEFKTPLTTMILNADTLQNAYMDEAEMKTAVAYIARQCQWLERLTQKLLKLITLKGQIKTERASLPLLFERVQESMVETLEQRGTPLVMECAMESLEMDADLMQSVLINLVDNASKASQPGQTVHLLAYDNIIEVADQGCGIPEQALVRITEPFYMVDQSRSKKNGGTGLGLALVKEIVTAHDADLQIDSKVGSGTTVRIQFKR